MKRNDALFASMYERMFYAGSFYDGIKVGHPDEFDLDLLLALPKNIEAVLTVTNIPGFVAVQLQNIDVFEKNGANNSKYR